MIRVHLKQVAAAAAVSILIAVVFVHWAAGFVRAEQTLYSRDSFHYWKATVDLALEMKKSVWLGIAALGRSMHHDYNDTCALPGACVMAIFGTSRLCLVVSNAILLIIPTTLTCLWLWVRGTSATWSLAAFFVVAFLALLAVPLLWNVVTAGYFDVGGVIMAAIATDLLSRTDVRSRDTTRWLAIGAAMGCLALCKRWFLYYVIALIMIMMAEVTLDLLASFRRTRSFSMKPVFTAAYGPALCGCSLVGVYMLTFPLPLAVASTNYSDLYSAYQIDQPGLSAVIYNFYMIMRMFGIAQFALACACFVAALFFASTRRRAIYLFLPGVLALINFSRVQSPGEHHMLMLFLTVAVTPLFFAAQLCSPLFPRSAPWGWGIVVLAALISCLNFQSMFLPSPPFGSSDEARIFSQPPIRPDRRGDLAEMENLMRFIADKVGNPSGQPPEKKVYLLASSVKLNASMLINTGFQFGKSLPGEDYLYDTKDVDRRDGFPDDLIKAQMVLVADPLQTHLTNDQKVVSVPTGQFLSGEGFSHAFTRDSRVFQLDHGVRVYVFERVRPSTPEEVTQLRKDIGLSPEKIIHERASQSVRCQPLL